jgi:hypothetical protein
MSLESSWSIVVSFITHLAGSVFTVILSRDTGHFGAVNLAISTKVRSPASPTWFSFSNSKGVETEKMIGLGCNI